MGLYTIALWGILPYKNSCIKFWRTRQHFLSSPPPPQKKFFPSFRGRRRDEKWVSETSLQSKSAALYWSNSESLRYVVRRALPQHVYKKKNFPLEALSFSHIKRRRRNLALSLLLEVGRRMASPCCSRHNFICARSQPNANSLLYFLFPNIIS